MVSLRTPTQRFSQPFKVIEGAEGYVHGVLAPASLNEQPAYLFVKPRQIFRTPHPTALRPGMVIRSKEGTTFIVGENGPNETRGELIWSSFRLFEPTGQYLWERRGKMMDAITKTERDNNQLTPMGMIWAALEPLDRLQIDREMRQNFEQRRIIAGAPIQAEDIVDGIAVSRVDIQLGLSIGILT